MDYYLAHWNLENLFDVQNSPNRPPWLQTALKKELAGWDSQVLNKKQAQLAKIIRQMNSGRGPDLMCVCEVENKPVLEGLVAQLAPLGRNYGVAHHDTSDQRGIDVAFIYDKDKFTAEEQFFHVILKRAATRDLFQVNFRTQQGNLLIAIGNHWPSRSAGQYESEPYRIIAGETLSYWASRIADIQGKDAAVLVMGDFNDEPFNRSVTEYALAGNSILKVTNATGATFYNLMWRFHGQGIGTFYFSNVANVLDQFWASRSLFMSAGKFHLEADAAAIEKISDMVAHGEYRAPRPFGRPSESTSYDPDGYSDHFPISLRLSEKD